MVLVGLVACADESAVISNCSEGGARFSALPSRDERWMAASHYTCSAAFVGGALSSSSTCAITAVSCASNPAASTSWSRSPAQIRCIGSARRHPCVSRSARAVSTSARCRSSLVRW
jgi:hypothetical protein